MGSIDFSVDPCGNPMIYHCHTIGAMSFKYDNNGIRTKKTVNGVETKYFYVGDTLVSQKTGDEVINFAYTVGEALYGIMNDNDGLLLILALISDKIEQSSPNWTI